MDGYNAGIWFRGMDDELGPDQARRPVAFGNFVGVNKWITTRTPKKIFDKEWLPRLLDLLCEYRAPKEVPYPREHSGTGYFFRLGILPDLPLYATPISWTGFLRELRPPGRRGH